MRNLAQIGYEVSSLEDFQALAEEAMRLGKSLRAGRNQYFLFSDSSGAQLWVQHNEDEEISGMNAHFDAKHWLDVELLHAQAYDERPMDGTFEAKSLYRDPGLGPNAEFPIIAFDLPDAHLVPKVHLPAIAKVQLIGFAREIHCYENIEDFRKANPSQPLEGLRPVEGDQSENSPISSLMRLDGLVMEAKEMYNAHSDRHYYWLLIKTSIGPLEVVGAKRSLPFLPKSGMIFDGHVRLSGKVEGLKAHEVKPGIFERLFWGAANNTRS
jgi:hypothetical protein